MSLQPTGEFEIPAQTAQVARTVFPNGNVYLTLRDELGVLFTDEQFASLYPHRGQPAEAPWRLALVTLMQFAENLTDHQAADAVRSRIDWKYALGLELTDPGFHYSVLCEFRGRLLAGQAEQVLLDALLQLFKERGLLKARRRQRTDSTHILAAVRQLNRLELVAETLYHALDVLAQVAPAWLRSQVSADWFERYSQRQTGYRLPRSEAEQRALAEQVGRDGWHLFAQVWAASAPEYLRHVPAVEMLRRIWLQNYYQDSGTLCWRDEQNRPPGSQALISPYDAEARACTKRDTHWQGYKVHLTETCEPDSPNLITHVETTLATEQDNMAVERIHAALQAKGLPPSQHIVDTAYPSAELLVSSQEKGIDLVGPLRGDSRWQARLAGGYDQSQFAIDWAQMVATCPEGQRSIYWKQAATASGKPAIHFAFTDLRVINGTVHSSSPAQAKQERRSTPC